jgi:hypothetical protein
MLTALFYYGAYYLVSKFMPGVRLENGEFTPFIFLPALGIIVGILDGLISLVITRNILSLVLSPVIYTVLTVFSWVIAKLLPWTRNAEGIPTENGFLIVAILLTVVVSSSLPRK